jgi:uncharacterized protein (DUF433 family)
MMDWASCDAVERDPDKVSGAWVFRGTRVPVTALFENIEGGASIDDCLSWFPGVTREQVRAVLEYEAKNKMRQYNLEHWVCFECRKMFKRPFRVENDGAHPKAPVRPYVCPQCREPMINMGMYFEPPRQDDLAGWKKMRLLADFGYFFYTEDAKAEIVNVILGTPPLSVSELRKRLIFEREKRAEYHHSRNCRILKKEKRDKARLRHLE